MCLLATSEFSHEAVKKHQETVITALKVRKTRHQLSREIIALQRVLCELNEQSFCSSWDAEEQSWQCKEKKENKNGRVTHGNVQAAVALVQKVTRFWKLKKKNVIDSCCCRPKGMSVCGREQWTCFMQCVIVQMLKRLSRKCCPTWNRPTTRFGKKWFAATWDLQQKINKTNEKKRRNKKVNSHFETSVAWLDVIRSAPSVGSQSGDSGGEIRCGLHMVRRHHLEPHPDSRRLRQRRGTYIHLGGTLHLNSNLRVLSQGVQGLHWNSHHVEKRTISFPSFSTQVWYRVIQIVINRDDVQGYAAKTVFEVRGSSLYFGFQKCHISSSCTHTILVCLLNLMFGWVPTNVFLSVRDELAQCEARLVQSP